MFVGRQLSRGLPKTKSPRRWYLLGGAILGATAAVSFFYNSQQDAKAFGYVEECLHPPKYPWNHKKIWESFDHAAIRRGFLVYNTIGAPCHSLKYRYYRQLVDVAFTEDEVKAIAAEYDDYLTEPDDEGDVHKRPGLINDKMHQPYENDKQARASNNGALPPDLSQIVRARDAGEDYIFALLTGYRDAPHGVHLGENMNYNIYFPGCQIAMPAPLAEGAVTYDDGTEASISQQAKDVSIFLTWSALMEQDERHLMGGKVLATLTALMIPFFYFKRHRWAPVKKRKIAFLRRKDE
uniref:Cytochrome c domain-containing protein n=1 Tax=Arcella intermedia TaxID=1963864 RepID=A0A6B2LAR4_9EUKA|eukprot:TRINITY_DN803_c0_g1_i1.p1 TRINITY_DN803_c0_g1~~TRINITY_DN803_c0_g1_i1.p1  ORF type:complete len:317 (+),score=40.87 TRINITY_DN803_c0_g1_i1:72-953(+)